MILLPRIFAACCGKPVPLIDRPVSRVLDWLAPVTIIYLELELPQASSSLPEG
jgi:hypothetical protein